MKKMLRKKSLLFWYSVDGTKKEGMNPRLSGDCSGLRGECSGLWGICTGLRGDCLGVRGDCSGVEGDFDDCEISKGEFVIDDLTADY